MRCTLALCVVLAISGSAWSADQDTAAASVTQTPAVTAAAPVVQATGSPTATVPTTTAPMMMPPGTYVMGTQPVMTYSTPASTTTYYYPPNYRGGPFRRFFRIFQPMNAAPTMAASPAYSSGYVTYGTVPAPTAAGPIVQTNYSPVPTQVGSAPIMQPTSTPATTYTPSQQVTYTPARRGLFGLGLFQGRRRQLANPMYTTAAPVNYYYYAAPAAATQPATTPTTASAPAGTSPTTTAPTYQETQYTAPSTTAPATSLPAATTPSTTTPSTTTPPAPPIPQVRTPRGTP
jgi:hypothetical protein